MTDGRRRAPAHDSRGDGPDAAHPRAIGHAAHDLALVAAHATGDTNTEAAARAERLLATCAACRELAADVRAIRLATRALPAPTRRRDFRISEEQAARLRPSSPLARLAKGLLAPRGYGRQLSGALMTLGVAGLLFAAIPALQPGSGGSPTSLASRAGDGTIASPRTNDVAAPEAVSGPGRDGGEAAGTAPLVPSASGSAGDRTKNAPGAGDQPPTAPAAGVGSAGSPAARPGNDGSGFAAASAPAVAPDQAAAPGGAAGQATGAAGEPGAARDVTAPTVLAWTPAIAVLSGLALAAGLGLYLLRRRANVLAGPRGTLR